MRRSLVAGVAFGLLSFFSQIEAKAAYVYVGSWIVGEGPTWISNPQVFSGREAAAFLFGGASTDYAISTTGSDVASINFRAYLDGYGDLTYLTNPASDTYSLSSRLDGGYDQSPSFSAYVQDHTCYNRYFDPSASCMGDGVQYVNYAFRFVADPVGVPEPASFVLLSAGLLGLAAAKRRRHIEQPYGSRR